MPFSPARSAHVSPVNQYDNIPSHSMKRRKWAHRACPAALRSAPPALRDWDLDLCSETCGFTAESTACLVKKGKGWSYPVYFNGWNQINSQTKWFVTRWGFFWSVWTCGSQNVKGQELLARERANQNAISRCYKTVTRPFGPHKSVSLCHIPTYAYMCWQFWHVHFNWSLLVVA